MGQTLVLKKVIARVSPKAVVWAGRSVAVSAGESGAARAGSWAWGWAATRVAALAAGLGGGRVRGLGTASAVW